MPAPRWANFRSHVDAIVDAVMAAVDPYALVVGALQAEDDPRPARVLALGKAAGRMAQAAEDVLGDRLIGGLVITKYDHPAAHRLPTMFAGHPVPDAGSLAAGEALRQHAAEPLPDGGRWLVLISGGGSALVSAPVAGVSLADLRATNTLLLASGADINAINAIRKHLSTVKGGQLARMLAPAPVRALVLSDVLGNPLDVIASGPLAPDTSSFGDCAGVLDQHALWDRLPATVAAHLRAGLAGTVPDTPKAGDAVFAIVRHEIVGDVNTALDAAAQTAEELGFAVEIRDRALTGEAADVGQRLASGPPVPGCALWGGETTVTLSDSPGMGGRNQTLALSAALALAGQPRVGLFSVATDGGDGPTDAAGAIVDGTTVARATAAGYDSVTHLRSDNAWPLFAALGDLIVTGPSGSNVNDVTGLLCYEE